MNEFQFHFFYPLISVCPFWREKNCKFFSHGIGTFCCEPLLYFVISEVGGGNKFVLALCLVDSSPCSLSFRPYLINDQKLLLKTRNFTFNNLKHLTSIFQITAQGPIVSQKCLLNTSGIYSRKNLNYYTVFLPGESNGQRNLVGCNPLGCAELGTTEQLTLSLSFK